MKTVLREPLVHFLALGAMLFLFFEWKGGGSGPGSTRIAITPGVVEHLASGFAKTWQRPPTDAELKGLIDEHVKEEIAAREATSMGLDRDDAIIRRRLRQKMEFLVEDAVDQTQPKDAELQAWLERHPDAFQAESRVALAPGLRERGAPGRVRPLPTPRSCSLACARRGRARRRRRSAIRPCCRPSCRSARCRR